MILLSGCIAEKKSSSEVTLDLQGHQENFQTPSYIYIPSNQLTYACKDTILETPEIDYTLTTSYGYLMPDKGHMICLIDNLPSEIPPGSNLRVSYHNFMEKGYDYDIFEKVFPINNIANQSDKRLVRNLKNNKEEIENLLIELPSFEIQTEDDYSGATFSLKKILETHSVNISQNEIFNLIQQLRTIEVNHPRDVSLLDTKNVAVHLGISATAYTVLDKNSSFFETDDLDFLISNTPFLTILSIWGNESAVAVIEFNHEFLVIMHPHLGHIKIEIKAIESGLFLKNNEFIVQVFNSTEP
jgi:hypothetical protein